VKLLDFGVSKMRGVGRTTGAFALLGTPSYMSPEQAQGQTDLIGPSTDVWAMGTILYEMATQRVAFTGESLAATVVEITSGRPEPIETLRPDAPPAFVELVDRAISLDPQRRIVTIEELRAGLKSALEPRLRAATPVQGIVPLGRPSTGPIEVQSLPIVSRTSSQQLTPPAVSRTSSSQPLTPPVRAQSPALGTGPTRASSPALAPPVTSLPPPRSLNYWIIGTTAIVAIVAVLLVMFLT
jgi:serine/threonine-protein kinase